MSSLTPKQKKIGYALGAIVAIALLVALCSGPAAAAPNPTMEPTYALRYTVDGASQALSIRVVQTRPHLGDEVVILGKPYIVTRIRIDTDSPGYEGSTRVAARVPVQVTVERIE